jgi:hypothetical protein
MSHVTNAVIHCGALDSPARAALADPLPDIRTERFLRLPYNVCGGSRVMETDLYAAAFNHIRVSAIIAWFISLPWTDEDDATLSIYDQDGECVIVRQFGGEAGIVEYPEPSTQSATRG